MWRSLLLSIFTLLTHPLPPSPPPLQGVQLYSQMASGLRERKDRFKKRMSYFWTVQSKEPEQK